MSLQKQYLLICLVVTILLGGAYFCNREANFRSWKVNSLQSQLFRLNELANILRNSVQDQLRYAHDYYHTGDHKHIEDFKYISAWRGGRETIPLSYAIGGGRRIDFEKLIKEEARSNADIVPLIRACRDADILASYEMRGILALQGFEPDGKTPYKGIIAPKILAKQILLGAEVYRRKNKVNNNIDKFLSQNSQLCEIQFRRLNRVIYSFRRIRDILGLLIGVVVLGTAFYLIKVVFIPISRGTKLAAAITSGDLSRRWKLNRNDELGQLSDAFDKMVSSLQEQVFRVEKQNRVTDRLISIVHQAGMGQWHWDLKFHSIEFDENCLKMMGYSESDYNGSEKEFYDRVHPEDVPLLKDFSLRFRDPDHTVGHAEFRVKNKHENSWVWVEAIGVPRRHRSHVESRRISGLLHNISRRKEAEAERVRTFDRLKQILDGIPARVTVINLETYEVLFLNQAALDKFGNVVGQKCYESMQEYKKSSPCANCRNKEVLTPDGKPTKGISWQEQSSLDNRWYEHYSQALEWEGGIMASVQIAFDINELREAQDKLSRYSEDLEKMVGERTLEIQRKNTALNQTLTELREAQAQLIHAEKMAALGHLISGIAHEINTPLGAIRTSNETLESSFGKVLGSLPYLADHFSGEDREITGKLIAASAKAGMDTLTMREKRELRKQVSSQLEDMGVPEPRASASLIINLQLTDYIEELVPLLKDEDAETLLNAIQSITNIQRSTAIITTAVNKAAKTVFALKTYAHTDSTGREIRTSLTENVDTVLVLYHNQIKHNVELICDYDKDIPEILCHPDELNQVWTNLIHNALQAMEYKGTLKVSIKKINDTVAVAVSDTGCGIPDEVMPRIFEPFFTTKSAGEGSGLGLDIVKGIVEKHGGTIKIDSTVGQGTTFTVTLPLHRIP